MVYCRAPGDRSAHGGGDTEVDRIGASSILVNDAGHWSVLGIAGPHAGVLDADYAVNVRGMARRLARPRLP
jgi:hypothetical protein